MAPSAQLRGVIRLQAGSKVEVHGLEKKPELNGLVGECLQFDAAKMRWGVQLPDGAKILLKMANLRPVSLELSQAAPTETAPPAPPPDAAAAEAAPAGTAPPPAPGAAAAAAAAAAEAADARSLQDVAPVPSAAAATPLSPSAPAEVVRGPEAPGGEAPAAGAAADAPADAPASAEGVGGDEADPLAAAAPKPPPRTGRWWQNESAAAGFAAQLRANDPSLTSLCLVPPKRFDEPDVEEISAALEGNTFCEELLASGHSLSDVSCERLARVLRVNRSLKTLSLGDSGLGDRAAVLFRGLAENVSLTSLDLEHKGLPTKVGQALAEALTQRGGLGAPTLQCLRLSRNPAVADALEAFAAAPAPVELLLCEGGLSGARHAAALGRWAAGGVERLDLRGNSGFGAEGVELLLAALVPVAAPPSAPPLRRLVLDGCAVGDDGVEALAEALERGLALEELSLDGCEVTAHGCEFLVRAMHGGRFTRLCLRSNNLEDEGCAAVAGVAESLDLSSTDVGPGGLSALAKQQGLSTLELFNSPRLGHSVGGWCAALAPTDWLSLRHLDMSCCGFGNDGFHTICTKLLEQPDIMPRLESLCLGGNDVDDSEEAASYALVDALSAKREGRLRLIWRNG